MNITGTPGVWLWLVCLSLNLVVLVGAALYAPWRQMAAVSNRQHLAYAAILVLAVFWLLNVEIRELLILHPMGITTLVMVFGWSFAVLIGAFAEGLHVFLAGEHLQVLPVNIFLAVVVPAAVIYLLLKMIDRLPVKNLFVYMLGVGFGGSILSVQVVGGVALLLFYVCQDTVYWSLLQEHYLLLVLLGFPEGFINGMLVTMLTVFAPDMLRTFDDHAYLDDDN